MYKSKDARSNTNFVRIAFRNKKIANDFVLVRTDSLGNIIQGKIIHVDKSKGKQTTNNFSFQGQFIISSLDRKVSVTKKVINGKWENQTNTNSLLEESDVLPAVVVTSYSYDGDYTGDWYCYGDFYDDDYSSGGGGYTYGYSGGGGYSGDGTNDNDNTINIEVETDNADPIKVEDYIKCFSTIPDTNATYKITLLSDIPVNGDPSQIFDRSTNSPGHSFIQLNKSSESQSLQQNFGFYPQTSWKAPTNLSVSSKVVDNAGHEFNASLSLSISSNQFQAALNQIQAISEYDYNITTWNCTDFALSVFNTASSSLLNIPQIAIPTTVFPMPTSVTLSNTPQGLYD